MVQLHYWTAQCGAVSITYNFTAAHPIGPTILLTQVEEADRKRQEEQEKKRKEEEQRRREQKKREEEVCEYILLVDV